MLTESLIGLALFSLILPLCFSAFHAYFRQCYALSEVIINESEYVILQRRLALQAQDSAIYVTDNTAFYFMTNDSLYSYTLKNNSLKQQQAPFHTISQSLDIHSIQQNSNGPCIALIESGKTRHFLCSVQL